MNLGKQIAWARSISDFGDMFRTLAFPLAVLAIRKDPTDLALSETFGTLGMFFGSLFTPLFIDRWPRLKGLVVSDFAALLCSALLLIGTLNSSLLFLFVGYFLMRAVSSFHMAAVDAVTADFLEQERKPLLAGFSRLHLFLVSGSVAGGLAAAQFVNLIPLYSLFVVDAITFVASSAWILWIVKNRTNNIEAEKKKNPFSLRNTVQEWKEGFQSAFSHPEVTKHIFSQALIGIAFGISSSTVRAHLLGTLQVNPKHYAYMAPIIRAFFLAGAFLNFRFSKNFSAIKIAYFGALLMLVGYSVMSSTMNYPLFVLFFGLQQLGNSFVVPVNRAMVMGFTESAARGRVAAFRGLVIDGATIFGNILAVLLMKFGTGAALKVLPISVLAVLFVYSQIKNWAPKN